MKEYITSNDILLQLTNLNQITFEVTDSCNLNCTYCGYGKFYSDFDERKNIKLLPDKAISLLEYLNNLWNSYNNRSFNKEIYISFYGGEPTLNMHFVKQIVEYIENEINCKTRKFKFSMTTNGLLLHKYIDYFIQHDFNLLISLDGDEYNNSYRINHNGNSVFHKTLKNIDLVFSKFKVYFSNNVNFNAVIHNRNSVESIYNFFIKRYNKVARIGELNDSGIREDMRIEFAKTYLNAEESLHQSENYSEIEKKLFLKSASYQTVTTYLLQYSEFAYKDYNELLFGKKINDLFIPSGTCIPFSRKIYVTVNGKLLPCERIGHNFSLGSITSKGVELDFGFIAKKYNIYYNKLEKQCFKCFNKKACTQCIFYLSDIENSPVCNGFMSKKDFEIFRDNQLLFLAKNPEAYFKIMSEVVLK